LAELLDAGFLIALGLLRREQRLWDVWRGLHLECDRCVGGIWGVAWMLASGRPA